MMLKEAGYEVAEYRLLPDEQAQIETVLKELSDEKENGSGSSRQEEPGFRKETVHRKQR